MTARLRPRKTRVVVIGPECAGKTTLASELAAEFDAPWTQEAARLYAEATTEPLSARTVEPIARLSMQLEDALSEESGEPPHLLVRDTDLVSTVVYARHYYGDVPEWIPREARARCADLYLLCHPDLPWSPDGVRDRPRQRLELLEAFRQELIDMRAPQVVDITGFGESRRLAARSAVERLLDAPNTASS